MAVLAYWVAFVAGDGAGRPAPLLWLFGGLVVAAGAGRALVRWPGLVSRMVAGGVTGAIVVTWPGVLEAGGAPTGYANSNATLTSLGVIAAIDAGRTAHNESERHGWLAVSGVLAAFTVSTWSTAGALTLGAALALLGLSAVARWPGFAVVGGMIVASTVLAVTAVIALGGDPAGLGERAGVRGELWAAAADLIDEEPVRGIGPGRFGDRSSVSDDADLRWAHHGYLQVAAELGIVGFALVVALAGYVWFRLWRESSLDPAAAGLGGAVMMIIAVHATVDHVWHVPVVLLVAAFWLSASLASPANV